MYPVAADRGQVHPQESFRNWTTTPFPFPHYGGTEEVVCMHAHMGANAKIILNYSTLLFQAGPLIQTPNSVSLGSCSRVPLSAFRGWNCTQTPVLMWANINQMPSPKCHLFSSTVLSLILEMSEDLPVSNPPALGLYSHHQAGERWLSSSFRTQVCFLAPTWWLATILSFSLMESSTLSWLLHVSGMHTV